MALAKPLKIAGQVTGGGPPSSLFFILALLPRQMDRASPKNRLFPTSCYGLFFLSSPSL